jgi:uncharacterized protein (DUF608 family)
MIDLIMKLYFTSLCASKMSIMPVATFSFFIINGDQSYIVIFCRIAFSPIIAKLRFSNLIQKKNCQKKHKLLKERENLTIIIMRPQINSKIFKNRYYVIDIFSELINWEYFKCCFDNSSNINIFYTICDSCNLMGIDGLSTLKLRDIL